MKDMFGDQEILFKSIGKLEKLLKANDINYSRSQYKCGKIVVKDIISIPLPNEPVICKIEFLRTGDKSKIISLCSYCIHDMCKIGSINSFGFKVRKFCDQVILSGYNKITGHGEGVMDFYVDLRGRDEDEV